MEIIVLINAIQKANNVIVSCTSDIHIENAKKYLELFRQQTKNDYYYEKLFKKLQHKRENLIINKKI
jgi:hypothetical protein